MNARDDAKAQYAAAIRERDRRASLLAEAEQEVEDAYQNLSHVLRGILSGSGEPR